MPQTVAHSQQPLLQHTHAGSLLCTVCCLMCIARPGLQMTCFSAVTSRAGQPCEGVDGGCDSRLAALLQASHLAAPAAAQAGHTQLSRTGASSINRHLQGEMGQIRGTAHIRVQVGRLRQGYLPARPAEAGLRTGRAAGAATLSCMLEPTSWRFFIRHAKKSRGCMACCALEPSCICTHYACFHAGPGPSGQGGGVCV